MSPLAAVARPPARPTAHAATQPASPGGSLPASVLPRATALTDLLVGAGAPRVELLDDGAAGALRERLERRLAAVLGPGASCVRIGGYDIAATLDARDAGTEGTADAAPAHGSGPFRWTAHRARRTVGLAALAAVLDGRADSPADAARLVVGAPETHLADATPSPGSCAEWLTTMPAPARAMVEAEAGTWATQLWTALDWARLGPGVRVGAPDRWWSSPAARRVAVRGRADVRLDGHPDGPDATADRAAHLLVLPGHPTPGNRCALALSALVDLFTGGAGALPRRVVGWWPDCGKAWAVPAGRAALTAVAEAIVLTARDALAPGPARR